MNCVLFVREIVSIEEQLVNISMRFNTTSKHLSEQKSLFRKESSAVIANRE